MSSFSEEIESIFASPTHKRPHALLDQIVKELLLYRSAWLLKHFGKSVALTEERIIRCFLRLASVF